MPEANGMVGGMVVSGSIAAAIGACVILVLSLVLPFPWSLGQTVVATALAAFFGAAVSFNRGYKAPRG
jgi:uncharacterized membrane protein